MQTLNQVWEEESHLLEKGKVFCERRNPFRTGFRVSLFTGCQANKVKTHFTATITFKIWYQTLWSTITIKIKIVYSPIQNSVASSDQLIDLLTDQSMYWLIYWLIDRLIDLLIDWLLINCSITMKISIKIIKIMILRALRLPQLRRLQKHWGWKGRMAEKSWTGAIPTRPSVDSSSSPFLEPSVPRGVLKTLEPTGSKIHPCWSALGSKM